MPQAIPPGLTRGHVLLALADLDAGVLHPFGEPTKYELVHAGRRYAPKAVVGLAHRHLAGTILLPDRFSGGEAPGQANYVLRQLGFTVVLKGEGVDDDEKAPRPDWTEAEVTAVVADYLDMLRKEMFGVPYNKTEHRTALRRRLDDRSDGSVEFKHANISGVLADRGLPYIHGYKPRFNYQGLLARQVEALLTADPDYLGELEAAPRLNPDAAPVTPLTDPGGLFEDPPEHVAVPPPGKPWLTRRGKQTDFVRKDAENRRLGRLGEEFVVELERARLRQLGRDDLARQVDWVADTAGDGLGFDVLSFDPADGAEQLVEVKTTGGGKYHPFYVSATEVRCSEDVPAQFRLYRVFDFGKEPRVYVLPGALTMSCQLEVVQYRAGLNRQASVSTGTETSG
ncbi:DUF3883 domain-containing protein [bacterium]|nr:DUF3883 domain-containing protein [bacterium]